ncbi:hypothetical protein HPB50_025815 [Hyalomma asiaticum]|uniref:Uncharacterized protein n=1 Tax=Hyalomma asiaticum TaxID=266040 RepID=A0ACB7STC4_HYAAI|nr:hypothetical protein HPB50_025815 [Hyalomma asiaticum]
MLFVSGAARLVAPPRKACSELRRPEFRARSMDGATHRKALGFLDARAPEGRARIEEPYKAHFARRPFRMATMTNPPLGT